MASRESDSISLEACLAWQPTSQLPKDLGAEAGQGPESCPLSKSLTPKGFQESKKRAGSSKRLGPEPTATGISCVGKCAPCWFPEKRPPGSLGVGRQAVWMRRVWTAMLVGVGGLS